MTAIDKFADYASNAFEQLVRGYEVTFRDEKLSTKAFVVSLTAAIATAVVLTILGISSSGVFLMGLCVAMGAFTKMAYDNGATVGGVNWSQPVLNTLNVAGKKIEKLFD